MILLDTFKAEELVAKIQAAKLYSVVQLSDLLRLAIIFKFGGWYSDFDTLFFKSFKNFDDVDVISTDNLHPRQPAQDKFDHLGMAH